MNLFKKAGEKFEETKRAFVGGDEPAYACRACEEYLDEAYEHCPHCGEPSVEPLE